MKGSHSGILWNEDMRRCGVVDNAEKVKKVHVSFRWYADVLRRGEEESLRDIMEWRHEKKMWSGRQCKEDEGSTCKF